MINKELSEKILSIGLYYKENAPGGMAAVADSYSKSFKKFNYIASWKDGNRLTKFMFLLSSFVSTLWELISNREIKVLHIHTAAHASFYRKSVFIFLGKLFGKKNILHIHASQFKDFYSQSRSKRLIIYILNSCSMVIVLSKSWKKYFKKIGVHGNKIKVLNNIVQPPKIDSKLKNNEYPLKLLFLGEIGDRKGIFDLLTVFSNNRDFFKKKIQLNIGGNGEVQRLLGFIEKHNLKDFVTFLGWVSNAGKHTALIDSDIFILPSHNEGLPIAILEAMSYGKPVISTDVGGIAEVVKNDYSGCLISPGDLNAIYDSLELFINKPSLIKTYRANCLSLVTSYHAENVIKDLECLYNLCLGEQNG